MNISMVVCTYNRVELLKKSIDSILKQTVTKRQDIQWELLVIDNNSTDATKDYVLGIAKRHANVRYFLETQQGLGSARNAGLRNAKYDVIAYMDDDEWADEKWAEEILRVFDENENAGCVGGPYYLEDKEKIPWWICPSMYTVLGDVWQKTPQEDYSETMGAGLYGGNLAIARKAYLAVGGFPLTGRQGNTLLSDEDVLMCAAIFQAGFQLFYNPSAMIHHMLLPSRMTLSYFIRHAKGMAYTRAKKERIVHYFAELIWHSILFPIKAAFNCRYVLHHFIRIVSAAYKLKKACFMIINR